MSFNHKPITLVECPEKFKPIIEKIILRLDKKVLFESDPDEFLRDYEDSTKQALMQWLKKES